MSDKEYKAALKKGTITEKNDITWKATAEEMANATIEMWERDTASGKKIENLKEKGYLDENGKVLPGVKDKLVKAYKKAMNAESRRMILPYYEEYQTYLENSDTQFHLQEEQMNIHMDNLKIQIDDINRSIETLDLYEDDCTEELKYINEIYHMGIDFEKEWQDYVAIRR